MKKRKKSLFQKTMVVILSAALVVGMLPTSALAAETKSNNFAGGVFVNIIHSMMIPADIGKQ